MSGAPTVREAAAIAAMQALLSAGHPGDIERVAVAYADSLLAALAKPADRDKDAAQSELRG